MTDKFTELQNQIDLLVEGELGRSEREALLRRLDESPEGWRRCALAFLETQSWRAVARQSVETKPSTPVLSVAESSAARVPHWSAIAATALLMLAVGVAAGRMSVSLWGGNAGARMAAGDQDPSSGAVAHPDQGTVEQHEEKDGVRVMGVLKIGGSGNKQAVVPILSGPGLDKNWLKKQPYPLSPRARKKLERDGWRIDQDRRFVTVDLKDGGQLTIPISMVRYRYQGRQVF